MNAKTITSLLLNLYRAGAFAGQREAMRGLESRTLRKTQVFTIQKSSGVRQVEVRSGFLWLTGQCGSDVVLHAGDRFELGHQWPYVVEALSEAQLNLR